MCRIAVYSGEPISANLLLNTTEHSLYQQSFSAKQLLTGSVNADGFGLGWYNRAADSRPGCYRRSTPIWADRDLSNLGRITVSDTFLANVRNATDSSTTGPLAAQPFDSGVHLFMHNGYIENFRSTLKRELQSNLSDRGYAALQTATDSETIFQGLIDLIDDGQTMVEAVRSTVDALAAIGAREERVVQLNFALSNGEQTLVTRWSNVQQANSLYILDRAGSFPDGTIIASEPLTPDEAWEEIPNQSLISMSRGSAPEVEAL